MNVNELRITKLKEYLVKMINDISKTRGFNVNALSKEIETYSLDKIPTETEVERWIGGEEICKEVFSFRTRKDYSYNEINNLKNIGFFEIFENAIKENNKKGVLPKIDGIETISCLNTGTMASADNNTAIFDIQIQITYLRK